MKQQKQAMVGERIILQFDPLLRSSDDELTASIAAFTSDFKLRESLRDGRRRKRTVTAQRTFHLAIHALLVNFIKVYARSPKALLNNALSNRLLRGSPRYRPSAYGKPFRDLITLLQDLGLIEIVTKGFNVKQWKRKELTTIRPTARLLAEFPSITTSTQQALTRVDPPEVIVLKNVERVLVDYADNADIQRWRAEVQTINAYLRDASIAVISVAELDDEEGFSVRTEARSLRRIFNNADWSQGGRLYDGFWQTMKRGDRLHAIHIDGEPIANVDFSQFNLRLAYASAGIQPPPDDLYDVTGNDTALPDWSSVREGRKKLTNAMFNWDKPLTAWPGQTSEDLKALAACFPKGTTARTATADIRAKHSAIAKYFEAGHCLRFMRTESDILVAALLSLMKRGITALPLHDAVLVPVRHAAIAKATLEREAKRITGTVIPAGITTADD